MVVKATKNLLDSMLSNEQKTNPMIKEISRTMWRALHLFPQNLWLKIKNGTSHLNPRWLEDGLVQLLLLNLDSVLHSNLTSNNSPKVGSNISHSRMAIKTLEINKNTIKVHQTNLEIMKVAITRATIRILATIMETLMFGTNNRTSGQEIIIDRVQKNSLAIMEEVVEAEVATKARHLWAVGIHEEI